MLRDRGCCCIAFRDHHHRSQRYFLQRRRPVRRSDHVETCVFARILCKPFGSILLDVLGVTPPFVKNCTLRSKAGLKRLAPKWSQLAILAASVAAPMTISRQVDVFPLQRREMRKQLLVNEIAASQRADGALQASRRHTGKHRAHAIGRPGGAERKVFEFKNEDVTEMASMRLDETLRRKFCALGLNGACAQRLPSHNNNESR